MPSPPADPPENLCLFGDSHLGCLKLALSADLVDRRGLEIEFWGADGPYFRQLRLKDGAIRPDSGAVERVELVNGRGRKHLCASDFHAILFMGARLRVGEFLAPFVERMREDNGYLSRAVARRLAGRWLNKTRSYRYAKEMAKTGGATILYFPTPLLTEGAIDSGPTLAKVEHPKDALIPGFGWDSLCAAARGDGISLIRQPEMTTTVGLHTLSQYGCDHYRALNDPVHKNAAFGAIVLDHAIALLDAGAATHPAGR
ncbi:hypothetical protein HGD85_04135 [Rhodobacteraceae bacterium R_SAG10]|nr:hypothetical protein [Rhodobacteraceae bacterium R_SAG10]